MTGTMWVPTDALIVDPSIEARYPPMIQKDYEALRNNIAVCGIRTPIFVAPAPDEPRRYVVLDGHHRLKAAVFLKLPVVPVRLFDAGEQHKRAAMDDNVFRRHMERADVLRIRTKAEREIVELGRTADEDVALLLDRFVAALRKQPESDRADLLSRLIADNRDQLAMPVSFLHSVLDGPTRQLTKEVAAQTATKESVVQTHKDLADVQSRLDAAQTLIKQYQGDLDKERERIVRLERQVEAASNRKAQPDDSAQKAKAEQAIKALQKELEEAKAQAVDFSRKLKDAQTERGDLDADVAVKTKRLRVLEGQVTALQQRETYWREHWRKALTVAMDPDGITRDLTRMAELAQHVREVLHSSSDWAPDVRKLVLNGIEFVGRELADLRNLAEQIGVVDEQATEARRGPETEEAA